MTKLTRCINGLRAKHSAVLGAQWGDEGKGKLVDILAEKYDICARFNGILPHIFNSRWCQCWPHNCCERSKIRFPSFALWHHVPLVRECPW